MQPKAVDIAVGIDGNGDVMLLGHRMGRLAYADGNSAVLTAFDHHLLCLGINRTKKRVCQEIDTPLHTNLLTNLTKQFAMELR